MISVVPISYQYRLISAILVFLPKLNRLSDRKISAGSVKDRLSFNEAVGYINCRKRLTKSTFSVTINFLAVFYVVTGHVNHNNH